VSELKGKLIVFKQLEQECKSVIHKGWLTFCDYKGKDDVRCRENNCTIWGCLPEGTIPPAKDAQDPCIRDCIGLLSHQLGMPPHERDWNVVFHVRNRLTDSKPPKGEGND